MKTLHRTFFIFILCGLTFLPRIILAADLLYIEIKNPDNSTALAVSKNNGVNFKTFTAADYGLPNNKVKSFKVINKFLYVLTSEGLAISSDGLAFTKTYTATDGISFNSPNSRSIVLKLNKGFKSTGTSKENMYFIADDGMYYFDGFDFKHFSVSKGFPAEEFIANFIVGNNTVYILTLANSTYRLYMNTDNTDMPSFSVEIIPSQQDISVFLREDRLDNQQVVYLPTSNGLKVFAKETAVLRTYTVDDALPSNRIQDVKIVNNKLYIATNRGLAVSTNAGDSFLIYKLAQGLESENISFINIIDDSGTDLVYLITATGLSIAKPDYLINPVDSFNNLSFANDFGGMIFQAFKFGMKNGKFSGDIYVISAGIGGKVSVSINKGASFTQYDTSNGLVFNNLTLLSERTKTINGIPEAIFYTNKRRSSTGVSVFSDSGVTLTNYFTSNEVFQLQYINDDLFIVTDAGLDVSTDSGVNFTNYGFIGLNILKFIGVRVAMNNNDDEVAFINSAAGLSLFSADSTTLKTYTTTDGLASNSTGIIQYHDTQLYVPTSNGLSILVDNAQTFTTAPDTSGLNIHSVFFENFGLLGDADESGVVNFDDIFKIFAFVSGQQSAISNNADCNENNVINFDDIFCVFAIVTSGE